MADIITSFKAFIEKIVKFFQDLVAQIRKNNDEGWPSKDETDPVA
ncbi:MAG: hypothetical protein ACI4XE_00220 [Acutalibacteraceae bacterium]